MKHALAALAAIGGSLLLTSCAGVRVVDTQTAAVVTERPSAIYIRPFSIDGGQFVGDHAGGEGERPIRHSLAPAEFANILRTEMERLAPTRVLQSDEVATQGWLVEGSIDLVDGGSRPLRALLPPRLNPAGRSKIWIHVRVTDLGAPAIAGDDKDGSKHRRNGQVIYEFDVAGGSRWAGVKGSATSAGVGPSATFDYRNAAERIRHALDVDPHRYGHRGSPGIR